MSQPVRVTLSGLFTGLKGLGWTPGEAFVIVAVSIDPRETPTDAAKAKSEALRIYGRADAGAGVHFLTGGEAATAELTDAIGFKYAWDDRIGQYAHVAGVAVVTPTGHAWPGGSMAFNIGRPICGLPSPTPARARSGPHRSATAPLLSLRSGDGTLRLAHPGLLCARPASPPSPGSPGSSFSPCAANAASVASARRGGARRGMMEAAKKGIELWPVQLSHHAAQVDWVILSFTALLVVLVLPVFAAMIYFAVKYRRGSQANRSPSASRNVWLETSWSVIPFVLAGVFFVWAASLYFDLFHPPADSLGINVVAKQWMWKFEHPGGQREINTLHVPVNTPVELTMISQDVSTAFTSRCCGSSRTCCRAIHPALVQCRQRQ